MNYRMIFQLLGRVLLCEAAFLLLPMVTALVYHEPVFPFLLTSAILAAFAGVLLLFRPRNGSIYAKEGFVCVGLSWLLMSLFGALPFLFSGAIPGFADAWFETASGFTTTGASILSDVESLPRGILLWRSLTQWIGGMGVLVFVMAVLPMAGGRAMHIMRAEVPGPTVGKLVPRVRHTARILYLIYVGMTVLQIILLLFGGMSVFDAVLHAFSTASTGGFSSYNSSVGAFNSNYIIAVIGIFMVLFGVNFNLLFLLLVGRWKTALRSEELLWYLGIVIFATVTIGLNVRHLYSSFGQSVLQAFFQVSSIMSSTGYATANYDLWPDYSRWSLLLLMIIGACAGSTAGGMKVSRLILQVRAVWGEIRHLLLPNSVRPVRLDGKTVAENTVKESLIYGVLYFFVVAVVNIVLAFNEVDLITNLSASLSCLSNTGPGFDLVGPTGNYGFYSDWSKVVLSVEMFLGRLEIFPILILFAPSTWFNK